MSGNPILRALAIAVSAALLVSALAVPAMAGRSNGMAPVTTEFTFIWPQDGTPPYLSCEGVRTTKTGRRAFTRDVEHCKQDEQRYAPGVVIFDPTSSEGRNWYSDYDGKVAVWARWVISNHPDGTSSFHILAYY